MALVCLRFPLQCERRGCNETVYLQILYKIGGECGRICYYLGYGSWRMFFWERWLKADTVLQIAVLLDKDDNWSYRKCSCIRHLCVQTFFKWPMQALWSISQNIDPFFRDSLYVEQEKSRRWTWRRRENPVGKIIKKHEEELEDQFKKPQAEHWTGHCVKTWSQLDTIDFSFPSGEREECLLYFALLSARPIYWCWGKEILLRHTCYFFTCLFQL